MSTSTSRSRTLAAALLGALALALAGCATGSAETAGARGGAATDRCIDDFDPSADYIPDTGGIQDAEGFELTDERSYQVLTVDQPYPGGEPESYVLVPCGAPDPQLAGALAKAARVEVPVRSLYAASTTHLAMLDQIGRLGAVTGVADGSLVTSPEANTRIAAGGIVSFASGGTVDAERVVSADPDVLVTGGYDDPAYAKIRAAGVPVVADSEWLESTALGRAEWVKVFGALTGRQSEAEAAYAEVRAAYERVAGTAEGAAAVPVLAGSLFEGTWYAPGGRSYLGRMLADAGGAGPWASDTSTGSLALALEEVVSKGSAARHWLVTDDWSTVRDALAADARYSELPAVGAGEVWTSSKVVGPGGGSDFYERGVARPDLVLGDLVAILHPELAPGHEFTFYRRVLPS